LNFLVYILKKKYNHHLLKKSRMSLSSNALLFGATASSQSGLARETTDADVRVIVPPSIFATPVLLSDSYFQVAEAVAEMALREPDANEAPGVARQ